MRQLLANILLAFLMTAPVLAGPRYSKTLETGGWTTSTAWSADGALIAAASTDGAVRIWDRSEKLVKLFNLHDEGGVQAVAFSPDGKYLAAGGETGGVYLLRLSDMAHVASLTLHKVTVKAVAWSPDSKFLASASLSGTVIIWDAVALKAIKSLSAHEGGATGVAFSSDGKFLATTGNDQSAKIWSLPDFSPVKTLRGFNGNVNAAAFSPDSKHLALVSSDHLIQIWHTDAWKITLTVEKAHNCDINAVAYAPNGKLLATAGDDGFIKIWNIADMKRLRVIKNYNLDALSLAFSPDGHQLAAGYLLGTLRLWDWTREDACLQKSSALLSADGKEIGKLEQGKKVMICWDQKTTSKIPVKADTLSGFVDRAVLGFSNRVAPAVRVVGRTLKKNTLSIEAVAYDDCALAGITVAGKKPSPLKRKSDPGNYSDVFAFSATTTLQNGATAYMELTGCGGLKTRAPLLASGKPDDWGAKIVEGKTTLSAPLKEAAYDSSRTLRTLSPGEPFVTVGYHKGYYLLQNGGWLNSDFVTGR